MKKYVEFRIPEEFATLFLDPNIGKPLGRTPLGPTVRAIRVGVDEPLYERIGEIDRQHRAQGKGPFFFGWDIEYHYLRKELEMAELFHLLITAVFEPAGEECGTVYDDSTACPICGAGRTQVTSLILDLRKVPKGKDIARTIADEWIVSQRLAEILLDAGMTGFELRPVQHRARYEDEPVDLTKVPSGRELLRRAEEAGIEHGSWEFYVWLNRPEARELAEKAEQEYAELLARRAARRPKPMPVWYQLVVTSTPVPTVSPTRFGIHPFDEDPEGRYRCPLGHVGGLNLLSEVWVSREVWDGSDIVCTKELVGIRRGLLMPAPLLLISPRLWRLLEENQIKGYKVEVAHFV
ncbi:MAG: hypothetical protein ACP5OO_13565 [Chloroflexia bacterium]